MNSIFHHDVIKAEARRRQLENEAEVHRMMTAYLKAQPGWWSHLLYNVGSALVVTGTRLKSRYDAQNPTYALRGEVVGD
jgi:hypothetical protein